MQTDYGLTSNDFFVHNELYQKVQTQIILNYIWKHVITVNKYDYYEIIKSFHDKTKLNILSQTYL